MAASQVLEDPQARLDLASVRAAAGTGAFSPRKPVGGLTNAAFRVRFSLRNPGERPLVRWLDTGNRTLWELDLYTVDAEGRTTHQGASAIRPFAERPLRTTDFVFPLELPAGQTLTVYLRMRSAGVQATSIQPALWEPEAYRAQARTEEVQWFAYAGAIATLGLFNLLLWIYLRDGQYGGYMATLLGTFAMVSFAAGGYGAAFETLTPNAPLLHATLVPFGWAAGATAPCWFMVRLLGLGRVAPRTVRVMAVCRHPLAVGAGARHHHLHAARRSAGPRQIRQLDRRGDGPEPAAVPDRGERRGGARPRAAGALLRRRVHADLPGGGRHRRRRRARRLRPAMGELVMRHSGTLERFTGDGMMIFFNDPIAITDPAGEALRMATEMQARFDALRALWQTRGYALSMGIGIALGVATIGDIGFEGRRDYGAIGGVTNLAARLCGEAKGGQILISDKAADAVSAAAPLRAIGKLTLKGYAQPQQTFEVARV